MVTIEDYRITCPFCKQQHERDVHIDDVEPDAAFLCKHPTADGSMCGREVDSQDEWCWSHASDG